MGKQVMKYYVTVKMHHSCADDSQNQNTDQLLKNISVIPSVQVEVHQCKGQKLANPNQYVEYWLGMHT